MEYTGVDVVIPAHDEQDLLAGCLDALEDCIAATPVPVTVTVTPPASGIGVPCLPFDRSQ